MLPEMPAAVLCKHVLHLIRTQRTDSKTVEWFDEFLLTLLRLLTGHMQRQEQLC